MRYSSGKAINIIIAGISCLLGQAAKAQSASSFPSSDSLNIIQSEKSRISLGSVVLHWTAPGDDGDIGRAMGYDIRYQIMSRGPIDGQEIWVQAIQLANEPLPSMAGRRDSMIVNGLTVGARYYFCIKTYDDAYNYSPLSNSPLITIPLPDYNEITGDINGSGGIDGQDLLYMVNALKGVIGIPIRIEKADVNGSCGFDGLDVAYLRAYLAGGAAPIERHCIRYDNISLPAGSNRSSAK